jgi:tyrosine-protein kinase Etk/Wzc
MNENLQESGQQQQQSLDLKVILFKLYRYWYTFILTIFIALSIAFLFNKYTRPIYEASTTILIKDKSEKQVDVQDILGLGRTKGIQNLTNQMALLSSYALANKTVTKLGFEVAYFTEEDFITKELYKTCPFTVILDTSFPQPYNLRFNLTIISKDKYKLEVKEENVSLYDYPKRELVPDRTEIISLDRVFVFGHEVYFSYCKFKILLNSNFDAKKHIAK